MSKYKLPTKTFVTERIWNSTILVFCQWHIVLIGIQQMWYFIHAQKRLFISIDDSY